MFDLQEFAEISPEWSKRLQYHAELGSTNDEALKRCVSGEGSRAVILADHQLAGRGRRGALWASEPGAGLLFSFTFQPQYEQRFWGRLALASGLAIATVLQEQWGLAAEVKWPNDVLVEGKKCCGILVETQQSHAVIGVGINVTGSPVGGDSVSLRELTPSLGSRESLLAAILDQLEAETAVCADGFSSQLERLREMCYLSGKEITFNSGGRTFRGEAGGVSDEGELSVYIDGELRRFSQGDGVRLI